MNPRMWSHPATRRNRTTLGNDGIQMVGPGVGEMAESGEAGFGRMAEPMEIIGAVSRFFAPDKQAKPLSESKMNGNGRIVSD